VSDSAMRVRFDGPILNDHSMDVADLAPSLLAIADLCKNANKAFNGDRAAVKVLVNADVKQNCFELHLELAMSILDHVKQLISHDQVRSAKEILEWVGLLSAPFVGSFGLIRFVQAVSDKKIESTKIVSRENRDVVEFTITGDNNHVQIIQASPQTYELAKNPANITAVKKMVEPLSKEGYETLQFDRGDNGMEIINRQDAAEILRADPAEISDALDDKEEPQVVTAWIKVYAPVYEVDAQKWRFTFNAQHYYMDVSETDIAERAMRRGGALVDDSYRVRLEMVQSKTSTKIAFKILDVLEFHPANLHSQVDFVEGKGDDS
jgi:hypothetical protein